MNWNLLQQTDQLPQIVRESAERKILIFKHSTRCSISRATLDRFERNWKEGEVGTMKPYFVDLIAHRDLSNTIAEHFGVEHESPQVLIISKGKSIYDRSHFEIDFNQIKFVS
jgi:bacillithiol system protein YtxJ